MDTYGKPFYTLIGRNKYRKIQIPLTTGQIKTMTLTTLPSEPNPSAKYKPKFLRKCLSILIASLHVTDGIVYIH